jgi:hypothetical protein
MTDAKALIAEARKHAVTTGPNMGICAADGVHDTPLGRVLRDECDLVQLLADALEQSRPRVVETVEELEALPLGSIALDSEGELGRLVLKEKPRVSWDIGYNLWNIGAGTLHRNESAFVLPVTVLYTPEEATK